MPSMNKLERIIEGLLFLSGDEGISLTQLEEALQVSKKELEVILATMMNSYIHDNTRGIELVCFADTYKFVTKAEVHPYAQHFFSSTKVASLSSAAMETLAIIAYKQPITRIEIEELRGVGCDMMIRKLLARNLICECGRSEAIGKPFLYEVTKEFMDRFQLQSLKELPELPDLKSMNPDELFQQKEEES